MCGSGRGRGVKLEPYEVLLTQDGGALFGLKPYFFLFEAVNVEEMRIRSAMWAFAARQHKLSVNQPFKNIIK